MLLHQYSLSLISDWVPMIRFLLMSMLLVISAVSATSQLSLLHGTWVNARFMEGLKRSHSVAWTMQNLPDNVPLWVSIDTTDRKLAMSLAYDFGKPESMRLFQAEFGDLGRRWAIGEGNNPTWMITPDVQYGQYVSLHWLDSLESNPIVLGRLPSRNTNPDFLLQRMIISALVTGNWQDSAGVQYDFKPNATVVWQGKNHTIEMKVVVPSYDVYMTLVDSRGSSSSYHVERFADVLVLTSDTGKKLHFIMKK